MDRQRLISSLVVPLLLCAAARTSFPIDEANPIGANEDRGRRAGNAEIFHRRTRDGDGTKPTGVAVPMAPVAAIDIFLITMRVGIIGFGRIGAEHAGWLKAARGVEGRSPESEPTAALTDLTGGQVWTVGVWALRRVKAGLTVVPSLARRG